MAKLCQREHCSQIALVECVYDPKASRVWLISLEDGQEPHIQSFLLCLEHADKLAVPSNWQLTDVRVAGNPQLASYASSRSIPEQQAQAGQMFDVADGDDAEGETAGEIVDGETAEQIDGPVEELTDDRTDDQTDDQTDNQDDEDMPLLRRAFRTVSAS